MSNQQSFVFSMSSYKMGFCSPFSWHSRRNYYKLTWIISVLLIFLWLVNLWIPSTLPYSEFFTRRSSTRSLHYNMKKSLQNLMAQPKFDFLPNYKNPCFIRKEATRRGTHMSVSDGNWKGMPQDSNNITIYDAGQDIQLSRDHQFPSVSETDQNEYPGINRTKDSGGRLCCLPYFIIAGFPKCGTTDLWHRMIQHPDIVVHPTAKEPMFFDNRRFYNDTPTIRPPLIRTDKDGTWLLDTYLEFFTEPTKYIEEHFEARNGELYHDKITGVESISLPETLNLFTNICIQELDLLPFLVSDFIRSAFTGEGSVNTMPINDDWFQLLENANLREPKYTNADHVHHLIPRVKIIVVIRDPVERLLSGHLYFSEQFNYNTSSELFHNVAVDAVNKFRDCLKYNTERGCAYNRSITTIKNRIRVGLYAIHIADWFRVFPRHQFLFLKAEDYSKDVRTTLVTVFDFLQLEFPPLRTPSRILSKEKINQRTKTFEMLPATRKLLQDFYRPYNDRLWTLLGDKRFHYTYP